MRSKEDNWNRIDGVKSQEISYENKIDGYAGLCARKVK